MNKIKPFITRAFVASIIIALLMINIEVDVNHPFSLENVNIEITMNEAQARQNYEPAHLADEICWATGDPFLICRYGGAICNAGDQGSWSSTDPGEG